MSPNFHPQIALQHRSFRFVLIAIFIVCVFVLVISLYWENFFDLNTKEESALISADSGVYEVLNKPYKSVAPQNEDNDIRLQKSNGIDDSQTKVKTKTKYSTNTKDYEDNEVDQASIKAFVSELTQVSASHKKAFKEIESNFYDAGSPKTSLVAKEKDQGKALVSPRQNISTQQELMGLSTGFSPENIDVSVHEYSRCNRVSTYSYQRQPTSDEYFIISQLKYGEEVLSDELFAYQEGAVQYLPIQLLAELLLLPVQVDEATSSLNGWYLDPERQIELSNGLLSYWANNGLCDIPNGQVFYDDWDLYLDVQLVESMFGLTISFDVLRQRFTIQVSDDIPLSLLLARQERFKAFEAEKKRRESQHILVVDSQNALVGDLAGHVDLGLVSQKVLEVQKISDEGFVQLRSDLGGHNAYVGYSWSDSGQYFNGYVEKFQKDSWIKHYRVGSVDSHSLPLVSESMAGLGIKITAGDGFTDDFRSIVIEGEIEPDWDVELYRNNSLVSIQQVGADARYRFTDVPFYIGTNQYQLRFFGPNGESRSESFSKVLDNSVLEQGSLGVNFGAMVREDDELTQYYLHSNWALTENITAGISLVNQENAEGDWLFTPKINMNLLGGQNLLQLNFAHNGEGYAIGTVLQGSSERFDWSADWQLFDDFNSWENSQSQLTQEVNVNLNANLDISSLSVSLSGNWKEYAHVGEYLQLNGRLAGQFKRLSYSNDIRWQSNSSQDTVNDRIAVSGKLSDWYLRSYLDIDILPDIELNQWVINANTSLSDDFNYQVEMSYQAKAETAHSIRNSISYLFDQSAVRLVVENYSDGDWFAQLKWNSSFLWQPTAGKLMVDRASYINTGAITIKAFQDDNANGEYDEGESPVKGLSFSGHSKPSLKTDHKGELLITHLQTTQAQRLRLNENSLSDPFLVPLANVISVEPHPGHIEQILYPILYTAEMEGKVLSVSGSPAKGLPVVLKNTSSDREYAVRVEFDGVFIFDRIVPGYYQLTIGDMISYDLQLKPGAYLDLGEITLTLAKSVTHSSE